MMVKSNPYEDDFKVAYFQFCSGKRNDLCLVDPSWTSREDHRADEKYETPMYFDTLAG